MRTKFSPSALKTYLDCSQKYYFEYEDAYVQDHKKDFKQPRPYFYVGQMVHLVISRFFNLDTSDRSWTALSRLLAQAWKGPVGQREGFESLAQEREFYGQAQQMLQSFLSYQNQQHLLEYSGDPESKESLLQSTLQPDLILWGRIDRIDREADGLHVIDYKTGKERDDEFQLMIYTMLAEAKMEEPVTRASYFYLKTAEMKSFQPDSTLRRETEARVTQTVGAIRQQQFGPKPTRLCAFCDYLSICPAKDQIAELLANGGQPEHQDFF